MNENFLPFAVPDIGEEEIEAAVEAMRSGWLTTGPRAAAFEEDFDRFLGGGLHAVAVNSATAGLHLALEAIGVGPGDEVLVPTWTFTATAEVVRYLGATPVLVDVSPGTYNVDLQAAQEQVGPRTKAIMPVHFGGLAIDEVEVAAFAERNDLRVVEDAAHALPSSNRGRLVGSGKSEATVFSFYATKTITTGEGGMVVTRNPDIAARCRTMRLHGISRDIFDRYRSDKPSWHYDVVAPGFKYNLPDPAAAMGRVQLARAHDLRDKRAAIASIYDSEFVELPFDTPVHADPDGLHAWHLYPIRLHDDSPVRRDEFIERMAALGVGCSVHFIPLHMHSYWRASGCYDSTSFPIATDLYSRSLSLPIFSGMSGSNVSRVVDAVKTVVS